MTYIEIVNFYQEIVPTEHVCITNFPLTEKSNLLHQRDLFLANVTILEIFR